MKILHTVEFYYPSVGGMQEVVKQLSERLVVLGHEVTVATTWQKDRRQREINGVKIQDFHISGSMVRGIQGERQKYEEFLLQSRFDIVVNFASQQWVSDLAFPLLERITGKKVFVPTGFSAFQDPRFGGYFSQMAGWMKKYDMSVFLSNDYQDINFARQHNIENITVIPNGAGEEFLEDRLDFRQIFQIPAKTFMVLHVGGFTGQKGHIEALKIFEESTLNNICLVMISPRGWGRAYWRFLMDIFRFNLSSHARKNHKKVYFLTVDRPLTVAAYQTADIFLFPSQIECSPLVLFECMAARTPFLTTDVGNAREVVEWSDGGEVLPTLKVSNGLVQADIIASVRMLEGLYADAPKRMRLGQAGFSAWTQRFQWKTIAASYEQLYKKLLASGDKA